VGGTAMFTSLDEMVDLTNIGTLFAFFLVCIGIMILRIEDPNRERPFRVPFGPYLLPILGAISCIGLAYYLPPKSWMRFSYWLLAGLVFYTLYGYKNSRLHKPRGPGGPPLPADFNPEQQLPEPDVHDHR